MKSINGKRTEPERSSSSSPPPRGKRQKKEETEEEAKTRKEEAKKRKATNQARSRFFKYVRAQRWLRQLQGWKVSASLLFQLDELRNSSNKFTSDKFEELHEILRKDLREKNADVAVEHHCLYVVLHERDKGKVGDLVIEDLDATVVRQNLEALLDNKDNGINQEDREQLREKIPPVRSDVHARKELAGSLPSVGDSLVDDASESPIGNLAIVAPTTASPGGPAASSPPVVGPGLPPPSSPVVGQHVGTMIARLLFQECGLVHGPFGSSEQWPCVEVEV
jgi:hypothetical protein